MSKELFVSSTPHETRVAIVENDQLAEVYFERENEYTLAGSIYKGRVTRVLPGMQSAFVDIGLERDAFLYVTDFFEAPEEDEAEYESMPAHSGNGERREPQRQEEAASESQEPALEPTRAAAEAELGNEQEASIHSSEASPQPQAAEPHESGNRRERDGRFSRRRRGRRGRGFSESKYDRNPEPRRETASQRPADYQPIILPGESISKYRNLQAAHPAQTAEPAHAAEVAAEHNENESAASNEGHFSGATPDVAGHGIMAEQETESPRRPTEEIDVPAVLAEHARTSEYEPRQEEKHLPAFASSAAPAHSIEEQEEAAEEESVPSFLHAGFDEEDYDDFEEEEVLDQRAADEAPAPTREFSQSGPESVMESSEPAQNQEERAVPSFDESNFSDRELEEEELQAAENGGNGEQLEAGVQPANARAELRGPSGIEQKVAYDRRNRGRRGGRRMRGHLSRNRRFQRGPLPQISELLKEGQEVLVQIAKEPIGKKGARITSHIALPGRFLVYMPTVNHNGVSRKISSEEERQRLKRIINSERQNAGDGQHGGFIVRTAAASASEEDLRADIRFLLNLWSEIRGRSESSKAPTLIYHDLNLAERILRDQVSEGFSHIWVDNEQEYERALRFVSRFQPSLVKRVKLYTKDVPLFEQFSIQEEINKALKSKVWLKSGGYIVINQTEALVAIDVNTGKYVGKTQKLEDTIVKTNVDAIKEIVRQIRLRDLGGIIVIDFIDMDERRNRQKVMQALEEALKSDRAPSKVLQFNDFGLVAITRKRVKQSLERTLGSPCTYCSGTGLIKSVTTIANEIYMEMRKMSHLLERNDAIVRVNPEVAKALKANNARWLQDMEDLTGKTVIVKSDPTLHQEQFDIH
jgi:ribonuclease G